MHALVDAGAFEKGALSDCNSAIERRNALLLFFHMHLGQLKEFAAECVPTARTCMHPRTFAAAACVIWIPFVRARAVHRPVCTPGVFLCVYVLEVIYPSK